MKIYVTQDDIATGCRFSPELCPVALALSRAGLFHFGVFGTAFLLEAHDCEPALLRLPRLVADWIASFDAGRPVGPVKFDIELPEPDSAQKVSSPQKVIPCLAQ